MTPPTPPPGQALTAETDAALADLHTIKGWLHGLAICPDLNDVVADGGVSVGDCYQQEAREFAGRLERASAHFRLASQSTAPTRGEERTHKPECWGATSFSDEKAHCYCDTAPTRGEGENPAFYRVGEFIGNRPVLCEHGHIDPNNLCDYCEGDRAYPGRPITAPTPPEPVASALAEGESPIITGSGFQSGRGGFEVIFVDGKRYSPRRLAKALVTAEAAAARIALLTAECEASMREIALLREDADAEKARADRLAGALERIEKTEQFPLHNAPRPEDAICFQGGRPQEIARAALDVEGLK